MNATRNPLKKGLLKGRRISSLKSSIKATPNRTPLKRKTIVDYFPVISNGISQSKNATTPKNTRSFTSNAHTPRGAERVGYVTEMSSADSDAPGTSADEFDAMPPPKRRCLRANQSNRISYDHSSGNISPPLPRKLLRKPKCHTFFSHDN